MGLHLRVVRGPCRRAGEREWTTKFESLNIGAFNWLDRRPAMRSIAKSRLSGSGEGPFIGCFFPTDSGLRLNQILRRRFFEETRLHATVFLKRDLELLWGKHAKLERNCTCEG
jgi:hypothetical protein